MPKISIVTATYNSAATLKQTIESIINQTYKDIEYIIIDGGSTDGTVDIIKQYGNRISYWVSEPDWGIYDAFNKGIKAATGDYIYFIGSDDVLYSEGTLDEVALLLTDDIDLLSGGIYAVDEEKCIERFSSGVFAANRNEYKGGMVPHQGLFVKTEIAKSYLFDCKYKIAADYKFFLQCYLNDLLKCKFVDLPIAYFSSGGTCNMNGEQTERENVAVEKEFGISNPVRNRMKSKMQSMAIEFLDRAGLLKAVKTKLRGWVPHKCKWDACRWCGRQ